MDQLLHQQTVTLIQASANVPNGRKVPKYVAPVTYSNNTLIAGSFPSTFGGNTCQLNSVTNFQPVVAGACGTVQGMSAVTISPTFRTV